MVIDSQVQVIPQIYPHTKQALRRYYIQEGFYSSEHVGRKLLNVVHTPLMEKRYQGETALQTDLSRLTCFGVSASWSSPGVCVLCLDSRKWN